MNPRALLKAAIADRQAFDTIAASSEAGAFSDDLAPVWDAVRKYYDLAPEAASADLDTVVVYAVDSMANPKHRKATEETIRSLGQGETPGRNIAELVRLSALARTRNELAVALGSRREYGDIEALVEQFQALSVPASDEPELDWNGIVKSRTARKGRMKLSPAALNDALGGGLLPGHNVTIFGLTESGKSALALTLAVGFAKRGVKVLYIINEDAVQDLMVRAVSCITGRSYEELEQEPEGAELEALRLGIGNLVMRELSPGTLGEVERLVRRIKPQVLVVDQLRNIRGAKADNYTQVLDRIAQGVRALGKKYKMATIGVTQAADSARNKAFLDTGDIDSSNIGIPGAADVLIGVGGNEQLHNAGQRMLSICKNKVTGRHLNFSVNLRAEISRFTSV